MYNTTGLDGRNQIIRPAAPRAGVAPHALYMPQVQAGEGKGLTGVNNTIQEANNKGLLDWAGEIITNHQQNNAQQRNNRVLYYIIGGVVIIALGMLIMMPSKKTKRFK